MGDIHTHRESHAIYRLTIDGILGASVEWSPRRNAWCIEDGVGRCLMHVEHVHGQEAGREETIRLARRMIRDGRMPTPEEANAALRQRREQKPITAAELKEFFKPDLVPVSVRSERGES